MDPANAQVFACSAQKTSPTLSRSMSRIQRRIYASSLRQSRDDDDVKDLCAAPLLSEPSYLHVGIMPTADRGIRRLSNEEQRLFTLVIVNHNLQTMLVHTAYSYCRGVLSPASTPLL